MFLHCTAFVVYCTAFVVYCTAFDNVFVYFRWEGYKENYVKERGYDKDRRKMGVPREQ